MSTLPQRSESKLIPFTLAHFIAWAKMQSPDEVYMFCNSRGGCAMGQYMADQGRVWDYNYIRSCTEVFGNVSGSGVLAMEPQTFGALADRCEKMCVI